MKHIQTFESINEASKFTFSEAEIKNAAETLAKAMAKLDKVKVAVHDFEYDKGRGAGFELSWDGDKFDGGSYYIKPNGDVVNAAVGGGTTYGVRVNESSSKDGGDKSNGNSHHEDHTDNTVAQHWKDIYGEEFHSKYPAVAKIVKQRNIKDKRELSRIWDETYGENFEEQYPALYNKLD